MPDEHFSTEKRVLRVMRKTLASIIRDLTPTDATRHYPLSDATVESVKTCLELISTRERELAQQAGLEINDKPHFVDEAKTKTSRVVSVAGLKADRSDNH